MRSIVIKAECLFQPISGTWPPSWSTRLSPFRRRGHGPTICRERETLLCHPSESIYILDMLEFSLNPIVKSPFLTNDAICILELVTIGAHGLELRAEEVLLVSKSTSLLETALWTSRTPLEHELFQG